HRPVLAEQPAAPRADAEPPFRRFRAGDRSGGAPARSVGRRDLHDDAGAQEPMTLLLTIGAVWLGLVLCFCCLLALAARAGRAAARARVPSRPRLQLLAGGAQDSSSSRTSLGSRSSRSPL